MGSCEFIDDVSTGIMLITGTISILTTTMVFLEKDLKPRDYVEIFLCLLTAFITNVTVTILELILCHGTFTKGQIFFISLSYITSIIGILISVNMTDPKVYPTWTYRFRSKKTKKKWKVEALNDYLEGRDDR